MPRPYWRGYLKLSLVTCPIELFPATSASEQTHFHRINKKTGHRLRQQLVDEKTGRTVDKEDVGRGYELKRGGYVEIEPEELEAVKLESTRTVEIDSFAPWEDIDRRYLEKPYYMTPGGKEGEEAFAVIRDAMKDKGRVAIGRIVMANREHILAIEAFGKGMLATTLRYPYEMRDEKDYFAGIRSPRVDREMIALAGHILDSKAARFDPSKFRDRYETALRALVKRKAAGKPIEPPEPAGRPDNVVNLFDALRQSLGRPAGKQKSRKAKAKSHRRKAA